MLGPVGLEGHSARCEPTDVAAQGGAQAGAIFTSITNEAALMAYPVTSRTAINENSTRLAARTAISFFDSL